MLCKAILEKGLDAHMLESMAPLLVYLYEYECKVIDALMAVHELSDQYSKIPASQQHTRRARKIINDIDSIKKDKAIVNYGNFKTQISLSEIELVKSK